MKLNKIFYRKVQYLHWKTLVYSGMIIRQPSLGVFWEHPFATLIPQMDSKAVLTSSKAALAVTAQKQFPSNK